MEILNKLKDDTLFSVEKSTVERKFLKDLEFERDDALERSLNSVDNSGICQITRLLNKLELETICNDYLQVEHRSGNNPHSKSVLTKRLGESLEKEGLEKWFKKCKDVEVLKTFAEVLALRDVPKDEAKAIAHIQKEAPIIIRQFGFIVVLNRLTTDELHAICKDMKLKNHSKTNNRKALINAIIYQSPVEVPEPVIRRTAAKKPAKKAIEKCTEYEQLFQHYFLDQLVDWCRENGLKTAGTKKILINRILAYLGGDKENTMADETRIRRSIKRKSESPEDEDDDEGENEEEEEEEDEDKEEKAKPESDEEEEDEEVEVVKPKKGLADRGNKKKIEPKKEVAKKNTKKVVDEPKKNSKATVKAPAKATTKTNSKNKKVVEEEEPQNEDDEEDNEEMTVDAERNLRSNEVEEEIAESKQSEDEDEEVEDDQDEDDKDAAVEGIKGITFCLTGHMKIQRAVLVSAIIAAGGKVEKDVTKDVQVLVADKPDAKTQKLVKAREAGVKVVGEDYLKKYLSL